MKTFGDDKIRTDIYNNQDFNKFGVLMKNNKVMYDGFLINKGVNADTKDKNYKNIKTIDKKEDYKRRANEVTLRGLLYSDFKIDVDSSIYKNNKLIVNATLAFNSSLINTINPLANNTHNITIDIPKNVAEALSNLKVDGVPQSNFNQVKLIKKTGIINGTLSKALSIPLELTFDTKKMAKNSGTIDVFDKSVGTIWSIFGASGTEYKANISVEDFYNDVATNVANNAIEEVKKQDMLTNSTKDEYIEKINEANSIADIIKQVENAKKENEENRKENAKADIDAEAAKVKEEIEADGTLTAEEKEKQKASVDQEVEKAKGAIDKQFPKSGEKNNFEFFIGGVFIIVGFFIGVLKSRK